MPNNQLLPFAHDDSANVTPISQWESATNLRAMGFQSGIAKSDEINRAIAQGANTGYAIGELIKDYAGADATIKPTPLYSNLKIALERFFKRQVIGFIYPVGSVYISTVSTNPATLFGVGAWQRIGEGRGLIDAGNSIAAGSTGGSATHTITTNEMPSHSHTGSATSSGNHNHAVSQSTTGAHSHVATASTAGEHDHSAASANAGTHNHSGTTSENGAHYHGAMGEHYDSSLYGLYDNARNHVGTNGGIDNDNTVWKTSTDGSHSHSLNINSGGSHNHAITVNSAGNHSHNISVTSNGNHSHNVSLGDSGNHNHSISIGSSGGGQAFSVRNPYLAVYIWKRVA